MTRWFCSFLAMSSMMLAAQGLPGTALGGAVREASSLTVTRGDLGFSTVDIAQEGYADWLAVGLNGNEIRKVPSRDWIHRLQAQGKAYWTNDTSDVTLRLPDGTAVRHEVVAENRDGAVEVVVDAASLPRQADIYVSVVDGTAQVTARLSDGRAPVFSDLFQDSGRGHRWYNCQFRAASTSPNQIVYLVFTIRLVSSTGKVAIQAVGAK